MRLQGVLPGRSVYAIQVSQAPMEVNVWAALLANTKLGPEARCAQTVGQASTRHPIGRHPRAHACNARQIHTRLRGATGRLIVPVFQDTQATAEVRVQDAYPASIGQL